ncbi:MAG: sulfatase-like hydrolase/transferase, partial [Gemmatimonadetes bacterium]|nr:sulfatase-like hydrolase/transferase [Gemmatimonadota bacterium]
YPAFPLREPGRACLMTGRHASEIGAWDNGALLAADQPTFAHYLAGAGYDTVLSGKMHFIGPDQLHGFRMRLTTDIYSSDFDWVKPEWIHLKETGGEDCERVMADRPAYNAAGYTGDGVRIGVWHNALSYDEETHFRAVEYLRSRRSRRSRKPGGAEEPFLLCASYHHPHEPFWPPESYWDRYEGSEIELPGFPADLDERHSMMDRNLNAYHGTGRYDLREEEGLYRLRRAYYALVSYMDDKVGGLLDTLDETGLAENTVVVFASDHGDMLCERGMVQKRCFYEWSCRVPLIVRYPDGWRAGTTCTHPVSLIDLLPTFCDLAGIEELLPHDGESLVSSSSDETDRVVFAQAHEAVGMPCIMARQGRYKYQYIHGYAPRLYDLDDDPGEWHDLSGDDTHRHVESRLRDRILDRFDPDAIAAANLSSLYRRRLIRDTMARHGRTWSHGPEFDHRRGALNQYVPPSGQP